MKKDLAVKMPIEQQFMIHGQIGNMRRRMSQLRTAIGQVDLPHLEQWVRYVEIELDMLELELLMLELEIEAASTVNVILSKAKS